MVEALLKKEKSLHETQFNNGLHLAGGDWARWSFTASLQFYDSASMLGISRDNSSPHHTYLAGIMEINYLAHILVPTYIKFSIMTAVILILLIDLQVI